MSKVISASSAIAESEITAAVAAVTDVFSDASIVNLVERMELPPSLISTVGIPDDEAVLREARTPTSVNGHGARQVTLAVPDVIVVISSDKAIVSQTGNVAFG